MIRAKLVKNKRVLTIAGIATLALLVAAVVIYVVMRSGGHQAAGNEHAGHQGGAVAPNVASVGMIEQPLLIVDIPLEKQQLIGVKYAAAANRALDYPIRSVARVSVDENSLFIISTRYSGFVEQLYAAETGQYINAGQSVAAVYSPELVAAQTEYVNLLNNPVTTMSGTDSTGGVLAAARERLSLLGLDSGYISSLEKTRIVPKTITVNSPAAGYVMQRQVLPGSQVQAGQPLLTVADLSQVWVIADIYEQDLALIAAGQAVTLTFEAWPDLKVHTTIDYIYPMLDPTTRTAKARMTINNAGNRFKPQMYGAVAITVRLPDAITVPEDAVINTGTRKLVYVDLGEGKLKQRLVTTGYSASGYVQVTSGLHAGERVVIAANFLVDAETRLHGEVAP
ncbi:MAG: efflux RND transporter periplasmic adaptor subunit [Negativicutes bacterium]|jgi:Cu(I)/Ag(I) efflux system membrane fusion protein